MKLNWLLICILGLISFFSGGCGDNKNGITPVPDNLNQPLPPPPVSSGGEEKGKQPSATGKID